MKSHASNKAVMGLVILIPCAPRERDGFATFDVQAARAPDQRAVRTLRDSDFKAKAEWGRLFQGMRKEERVQLTAVVELMQAWNRDDGLALKNAHARLAEAQDMRRRQAWRSRKDPDFAFGRFLTRFFGLRPDQPGVALDIFEGLRPPPQVESDPRWRLSYEVSRVLDTKAKLVLWWSNRDRRFLPALYCEDALTAFHILLLLRSSGRPTLCFCPHCGQLFDQKRPNQEYCTTAHREAHRNARFRARRKEEGKQAKRRDSRSGKKRRRKPATAA